jgi:hypothetical protein
MTNETPDYTKYTREQLDYALRHANEDEYPDRFKTLLAEKERREHRVGAKKERSRGSFFRLLRYQPPNYSADEAQLNPWRLKDVIIGLVFLECLYTGYDLTGQSTFLRYRPWVAEPVGFALWLGVIILLMLYAVQACRKRPWWHIVRPPTVGRTGLECLKALKYFFVVFLVLMPITVLFKNGLQISMEPTRFEWLRSAPNSTYTLVKLLVIFTLGPVAEELFFRGFLYSALRSRLALPFAAGIQAFIFSVVHKEDFYGSITVFILGIALAILYERRRNLLSPIILHAMRNALFAVPLLVLTCMNYHTPAKTWEEAKSPPGWLNRVEEIERQNNGVRQWEYAINTWGSKGSKQWKKEAKGFAAVCAWFPEERTACARAKLGITTIYYSYLNDLRRAAIETDDLLSRYPEQREQCAEALNLKGWACYRLRDFKCARGTFEKLRREYKNQGKALEQATKGIQYLDVLEKRQF